MTYVANIPGTDPAESAAIDEKRRIKRAELRNKIAEHELLDRRYNELTSTVAEINNQKEQFAARHVEVCQPLQNELAGIERKLVSTIAEKRPTDPKVELRRRELLAQIQQHNQALQDKIAAEDRLLAEAERERREVGHRAAKMPVESDLLDYGRSDLLLAMRVAQHSVEWADRRLRSAQERLEYRGHTPLNLAEHAAAEAAVATAQAESDRAYRAVVDE
jgi:hypothetical protein